MKKLLLSAIAAVTLVSSANAWDFCSDESQIGVAAGSMGAGVLIADATFGGVPGLIVGAVLNQVLCTPTEVSTANEDVKTIPDVAVNKVSIKDTKTVYFDYDKYNLNTTAKNDVQVTADTLKAIPGTVVKIEGNCDSRGSDEYNMALGLKRAEAVKEALINAGVTNKLETISYGETNPSCTDSTEDCFSKNRRVNFSEVK